MKQEKAIIKVAISKTNVKYSSFLLYTRFKTHIKDFLNQEQETLLYSLIIDKEFYLKHEKEIKEQVDFLCNN